METGYLKTLELNKIIERAAAGCVCKEARAKMLELTPQCDPDEVRFALEQTDAVNTLLIKNGSPRFGGVEGVSGLAARTVKGGVLSMGELLEVAGLEEYGELFDSNVRIARERMKNRAMCIATISTRSARRISKPWASNSDIGSVSSSCSAIPTVCGNSWAGSDCRSAKNRFARWGSSRCGACWA